MEHTHRGVLLFVGVIVLPLFTIFAGLLQSVEVEAQSAANDQSCNAETLRACPGRAYLKRNYLTDTCTTPKAWQKATKDGLVGRPCTEKEKSGGGTGRCTANLRCYAQKTTDGDKIQDKSQTKAQADAAANDLAAKAKAFQDAAKAAMPAPVEQTPLKDVMDKYYGGQQPKEIPPTGGSPVPNADALKSVTPQAALENIANKNTIPVTYDAKGNVTPQTYEQIKNAGTGGLNPNPTFQDIYNSSFKTPTPMEQAKTSLNTFGPPGSAPVEQQSWWGRVQDAARGATEWTQERVQGALDAIAGGSATPEPPASSDPVLAALEQNQRMYPERYADPFPVESPVSRSQELQEDLSWLKEQINTLENEDPVAHREELAELRNVERLLEDDIRREQWDEDMRRLDAEADAETAEAEARTKAAWDKAAQDKAAIVAADAEAQAQAEADIAAARERFEARTNQILKELEDMDVLSPAPSEGQSFADRLKSRLSTPIDSTLFGNDDPQYEGGGAENAPFERNEDDAYTCYFRATCSASLPPSAFEVAQAPSLLGDDSVVADARSPLLGGGAEDMGNQIDRDTDEAWNELLAPNQEMMQAIACGERPCVDESPPTLEEAHRALSTELDAIQRLHDEGADVTELLESYNKSFAEYERALEMEENAVRAERAQLARDSEELARIGDELRAIDRQADQVLADADKAITRTNDAIQNIDPDSGGKQFDLTSLDKNITPPASPLSDVTPQEQMPGGGDASAWEPPAAIRDAVEEGRRLAEEATQRMGDAWDKYYEEVADGWRELTGQSQTDQQVIPPDASPEEYAAAREAEAATRLDTARERLISLGFDEARADVALEQFASERAAELADLSSPAWKDLEDLKLSTETLKEDGVFYDKDGNVVPVPSVPRDALWVEPERPGQVAVISREGAGTASNYNPRSLAENGGNLNGKYSGQLIATDGSEFATMKLSAIPPNSIAQFCNASKDCSDESNWSRPAVASDRGYYVDPRTGEQRLADLTPVLKQELGCTDLCRVQYRVIHEPPVTRTNDFASHYRNYAESRDIVDAYRSGSGPYVIDPKNFPVDTAIDSSQYQFTYDLPQPAPYIPEASSEPVAINWDSYEDRYDPTPTPAVAYDDGESYSEPNDVPYSPPSRIISFAEEAVQQAQDIASNVFENIGREWDEWGNTFSPPPLADEDVGLPTSPLTNDSFPPQVIEGEQFVDELGDVDSYSEADRLKTVAEGEQARAAALEKQEADRLDAEAQEYARQEETERAEDQREQDRIAADIARKEFEAAAVPETNEERLLRIAATESQDSLKQPAPLEDLTPLEPSPGEGSQTPACDDIFCMEDITPAARTAIQNALEEVERVAALTETLAREIEEGYQSFSRAITEAGERIAAETRRIAEEAQRIADMARDWLYDTDAPPAADVAAVPDSPVVTEEAAAQPIEPLSPAVERARTLDELYRALGQAPVSRAERASIYDEFSQEGRVPSGPYTGSAEQNSALLRELKKELPNIESASLSNQNPEPILVPTDRPGYNASTLSAWYSAQSGGTASLPSFSERAALYRAAVDSRIISFDAGPYRGTAAQNQQLLLYLKLR